LHGITDNSAEDRSVSKGNTKRVQGNPSEHKGTVAKKAHLGMRGDHRQN